MGELFFLPLFVLDEFICQQGGEILRFPCSSIKGEKFGLSWTFGLPLIQGDRCVDSNYLELLVFGRDFWEYCDRGRKIEPFGAFVSCVEPFASFWRNHL